MSIALDFAAWGWPQWLMAGMSILTMLCAPIVHGQPRKPYNGFMLIFSGLLTAIVLYFGGFWA